MFESTDDLFFGNDEFDAEFDAESDALELTLDGMSYVSHRQTYTQH